MWHRRRAVLPVNRPPTDEDLRQAITALRIASLQDKFISDRLKWEAMLPVLDVDATHMAIADALVNRGGR